MSCVFCIRGTFDPDRFLAESKLEADRIWHQGEEVFKGRVAKDSGFSVLVSAADMDDLEGQLRDAIAFLLKNEAELQRLRRLAGVSGATLDFGIAQRDLYARFIPLPPELVQLAGACGLGIELSLYAVSEANHEES